MCLKPIGTVISVSVSLLLISLVSQQAVAGDKAPIRKTFTNSVGMKFVLIPAGAFMMGSPPDEPGRDDDERQHRVTIGKPFYLQATEVTVGQWRAFVRDTDYRTTPEIKGDAWVWIGGKKWEEKEAYYWDNPGFMQIDSHPVTCVSWNDVQAFIEWLNREDRKTYRLPTEAEWEYACRAGTETPFSFGRCLFTEQANYDGNYPIAGCAKGEYRGKTTHVESFPPNAWGLYDMHGNVWEWCQDWYDKYPSGHVTDPKGPSSGSRRVNRGGSWYHHASGCRSANRLEYTPDDRRYHLGFRVARRAGGSE